MPGQKNFKIYEKRHASGNVGYRVDFGIVNGKRSFKSFSTKAQAEKFQKNQLTAQARSNPLVLSEIDAVARHEVLAAVNRLKQYNATITEAVDFFLKHSKPARAGATIGEIMDEFKVVKTKAGLSAKYLDTARASFFVPFKDHFKDCQITDVTADAAEQFIYKNKAWNATSRATVIRHLKVLFNFAIKRGYTTLNPFASTEMPKKAANNSREKVMSVENVIKLLQYAYKNGYETECAALVLVFFCGGRIDEVDRVTWEQVKLEEETPLIVLDDTKANRRRVNTIPKNALAWLKELRPKDAKGKITPPNYDGRMKYVRNKSKSDYKQNSARISFASYHVAMHEDAAKTSLLLGHQNPSLLWNTYRAVVTKAEAQRYWKIMPDYTGEEISKAMPSPEVVKAARMKRIAKILAPT